MNAEFMTLLCKKYLPVESTAVPDSQLRALADIAIRGDEPEIEPARSGHRSDVTDILNTLIAFFGLLVQVHGIFAKDREEEKGAETVFDRHPRLRTLTTKQKKELLREILALK